VGCVILSAAKDLSLGKAQILRCAQDDSLWRPASATGPRHAGAPTVLSLTRKNQDIQRKNTWIVKKQLNFYWTIMKTRATMGHWTMPI